MDMRVASLGAFRASVAAGHPRRFEEIVKAAYEAGASREDLLLAVDSARLLAPLPPQLLKQAYATIHKWYWMERRRKWQRRDWPPVAA